MLFYAIADYNDHIFAYGDITEVSATVCAIWKKASIPAVKQTRVLQLSSRYMMKTIDQIESYRVKR